ncbi:ATP-binding protein [Streptomyces sp. NPDC048516]|uniref:ATP-binding protein n=1 Tax=Streptomyces sp. NPDC048516 TaxID=3365565 RepID=UPI00371548A5
MSPTATAKQAAEQVPPTRMPLPETEWDKIFADPRLCAAIADRITFRCTLIQTGTESYRFQATESERHSTER